MVADWNLTQLKKDGKSISPRQPIINCRTLMTKYGESKATEVLYPALDETRMSKNEVRKLDALIKKNVDQLVFSKTPVRTGDIIVRMPIENLLQQHIGNICVMRNTTGTMGFIVKGWGYYKGKKVMVSSLDYQTDIECEELSSEIQFQVYGYALRDSDTFQTVKSEGLIFMSFDDFTVKRLIILNAEIKE